MIVWQKTFEVGKPKEIRKELSKKDFLYQNLVFMLMSPPKRHTMYLFPLLWGTRYTATNDHFDKICSHYTELKFGAKV